MNENKWCFQGVYDWLDESYFFFLELTHNKKNKNKTEACDDMCLIVYISCPMLIKVKFITEDMNCGKITDRHNKMTHPIVSLCLVYSI